MFFLHSPKKTASCSESLSDATSRKWDENQTFHTNRSSFQYHPNIITKSFLVDLSSICRFRKIHWRRIFKDTRAIFRLSMFSTTRWNVDDAPCMRNFQFLSLSCMRSRKQKLSIFHSSWSNFLAWEFLYRAHELRVFCMKLSLVWWMPRMWSKAEIYRWLEVRYQPFAVLLCARTELFGKLKGFWDCHWSGEQDWKPLNVVSRVRERIS